jgi:hypothetical protein
MGIMDVKDVFVPVINGSFSLKSGELNRKDKLMQLSKEK